MRIQTTTGELYLDNKLHKLSKLQKMVSEKYAKN